MNKNISNATTICLLLCGVPAMGHNMACIPLNAHNQYAAQQLACTYNYVYNTTDQWRCYIQFVTGNGVRLVPQSTLKPGELGTVAIKADIFGVEDKDSKETAAPTSAAKQPLQPSVAELQRKGLKDFTRFTAYSGAVPLAFRFDGMLDPNAVANLYNRDAISTAMTLDQLRGIVGPGRTVLYMPELLQFMKSIAMPACTIGMPKH